jgi:hypothetical protein
MKMIWHKTIGENQIVVFGGSIAKYFQHLLVIPIFVKDRTIVCCSENEMKAVVTLISA